ncbi:lymphocyte function-associated antigen 3 isoform X2 [Oxyura jamaicensis]|uniref:lymphocyte function-associated antigen 3 isoform X2 n=1 Tax=Oxyura jamaicensis TaxID=8884 RepID=UPI0015A71EB1|nr:lymphocyte function-associated antigen 3 isoform X2 [Oxyura jamaicensis]
MKLVALGGPEKLLVIGSLLAHVYCEEEVFGISGENFTFPVQSDKKIDEAIWTKNKDKVAEWEGQGEPIYYNSLQNRGLLNKESGNLTIFILENSDNGTYALERIFNDRKNDFLNFRLTVLAPPSEPHISCNVSGDNFVLTCAADFQKPLGYSWKIAGIATTFWDQKVVIPTSDVDTGAKAACFIKYFETEKSSEITLNQCFPTYQGYGYQKRSRRGLIIAPIVCLVIVGTGLLIYLFKRKKARSGTGGADQRNIPGEVHLLGNHNADGEEEKNEVNGGRPGNGNIAASMQPSDMEEEETEAAGATQGVEDGKC